MTPRPTGNIRSTRIGRPARPVDEAAARQETDSTLPVPTDPEPDRHPRPDPPAPAPDPYGFDRCR